MQFCKLCIFVNNKLIYHPAIWIKSPTLSYLLCSEPLYTKNVPMLTSIKPHGMQHAVTKKQDIMARLLPQAYI